MGVVGTIRLAVQSARFQLWRLRHPGATFKDYFASVAKDVIQTGRIHPTLGENLRKGRFGEVGKAGFGQLLRFGMTPNDVCVDYGCGTLRVGVHAIRFLNPGRYFGLDIDQSLLDSGARLVGSDLIAEKHPRLRVISPETVREVAEVRPSFLFSVAVHIHVHPAELEEYLRNILYIVNGSGRAFLFGKWSVDRTHRLSGQSWAHSLAAMSGTVDRLGGRLSVLREDEGVQQKLKLKGVIESGVRGGILGVRAKG